jgi:hypothetical protein
LLLSQLPGGGGDPNKTKQKTLVLILYIPFEFKLADAQALSAEGFVEQTNIINIFYQKDVSREPHTTHWVFYPDGVVRYCMIYILFRSRR